MIVQVVQATNIDLYKPFIESLEGFVDSIMWRLALDVFAEHRRTLSGEYAACPRWKSYPGQGFAKDGTATALGQTIKSSLYWIEYADLCGSAQAKTAAWECPPDTGLLHFGSVRTHRHR